MIKKTEDMALVAYGTPLSVLVAPAANGCLEWRGSGSVGPQGYAVARKCDVGPEMPPPASGTLAHRYVWVGIYGPIRRGQTLRRQCGNPICVAPSHCALEGKAQRAQRAIAKAESMGLTMTHQRTAREGCVLSALQESGVATTRQLFQSFVQVSSGNPFTALAATLQRLRRDGRIRWIGSGWRMVKGATKRAAVLLVLCGLASTAHAQDDRRMHWPELGLLTAGAWDVGTTYRAWTDARTHDDSSFHERNPLINQMQRFGPRVMLPAGAAMEIGGWWLADRVWGADHPKVMLAAKIAGMATHVAAGIGNFRDTNRVRREQGR